MAKRNVANGRVVRIGTETIGPLDYQPAHLEALLRTPAADQTRGCLTHGFDSGTQRARRAFRRQPGHVIVHLPQDSPFI
jgi:hypothetical protein